MPRISALSLMKSVDCLRLGDIIYFPWFDLIDPLRLRYSAARRLARNPWFWEQLHRRNRNPGGFTKTQILRDVLRGLFGAFELEQWYKHDRPHRDSPEPEWAAKVMGRKLLRQARNCWVVAEDLGDELFTLYLPTTFIPPPYRIFGTGIGYGYYTHGLLAECFRAMNLHRLESVNQLGRLRDPVAEDMDGQGAGDLFHFTRYPHMTDVAVVSRLMAHNCQHGITEDLTRHLVVAAATHDAMIPAGGDTAKLVDLKGLDEDRRYKELFEQRSWKNLRKKFRLSGELLARIVAGDEPVASALLDIADKISYTGVDVWVALNTGRTFEVGRGGMPRTPGWFKKLRSLVGRHNLFASVWDAVDIRDSRVYFKDPDRLFRFLLVRALMFRGIYHNPNARGMDHTATTCILRCLYAAGEITPKNLVQLEDNQLLERIRERTGFHYQEHFLNRTPNPLRELHTGWEEARRREYELVHQGYAVLIEPFSQMTGTGEKFLVQTPKGITPFHEARPNQTAQLKTIFSQRPALCLYAVKINTLGLKPIFAQRLAKFERERVAKEKGAPGA